MIVKPRDFKKVRERLLARRNITVSGCWEWTLKAKTTNGYAALGLYGKKYAVYLVSFEVFKGKREDGFDVAHSCDNQKCFNPEHLDLLTHEENMKEAAQRKRMSVRSTNKLTAKDAEDIRSLYFVDGWLQSEIAEKYNIRQNHVSQIINNKKWKK